MNDSIAAAIVERIVRALSGPPPKTKGPVASGPRVRSIVTVMMAASAAPAANSAGMSHRRERSDSSQMARRMRIEILRVSPVCRGRREQVF